MSSPGVITDLESAPTIHTLPPKEVTEVEPVHEKEDPRHTDDDEDEDADEKKSGENPFIDDSVKLDIKFEDESVKVDIKSDDEGDDTPTLPLNKKKQDGKGETTYKKEEKAPMILFPITRLKIAWTNSSNVLEFVFKAIGIIFSTLGWFFCVGGVPLMSIVMLIVGCVYVNDCNIQPKIPIYLIVTGVFGTLQHVISVWTKYVPKESQGRLKTYKAYCTLMDCAIHLFMFIWFVLGCIWVYGVYSDVDYKDSYKDEYCAKGCYLFAFWILNISFFLLCILIVCTFCCITCIVLAPNDEKNQENSD